LELFQTFPSKIPETHSGTVWLDWSQRKMKIMLGRVSELPSTPHMTTIEMAQRLEHNLGFYLFNCFSFIFIQDCKLPGLTFFTAKLGLCSRHTRRIWRSWMMVELGSLIVYPIGSFSFAFLLVLNETETKPWVII